MNDGIQGAYNDVLAFHKKFGATIGDRPAIPDVHTVGLRNSLIAEEFEELQQAIAYQDLPKIADAGLDLIYVVLGTLISYGIDPSPLWVAVHEANMAKEGGGNRADGKLLKPPGWKHPDIAGILATQGAASPAD